MGWALRKFVKITRLAPLRIGRIKNGVDGHYESNGAGGN